MVEAEAGPPPLSKPASHFYAPSRNSTWGNSFRLFIPGVLSLIEWIEPNFAKFGGYAVCLAISPRQTINLYRGQVPSSADQKSYFPMVSLVKIKGLP